VSCLHTGVTLADICPEIDALQAVTQASRTGHKSDIAPTYPELASRHIT